MISTRSAHAAGSEASAGALHKEKAGEFLHDIRAIDAIQM